MTKESILEKIAGYGTCTAVSVIGDDILWPIMVAWLGPVNGGAIMTFIALVINLLLIRIYDALKRDVFGFEKIRELEESEVKGFWMWLIHKALKIGKLPTFIVLSFYDPFLSVIYMRKGINGYKMTLRDWYFFILAMIIACVSWTFLWQIVIVAGKSFFGFLGLF
jgi:hypothetical protein